MEIYQARLSDGECANVLATFFTLESAQCYCERQYRSEGRWDECLWWENCPWWEEVSMLMSGTQDDKTNTYYNVIRYDVREIWD